MTARDGSRRSGRRVTRETWTEGTAYDRFMGRWSERVAVEFVTWLEVPYRSRWLDVGCGTGRLTRVIGTTVVPTFVVGVDPSRGYATTAQDLFGGLRVRSLIGDGRALPITDDHFDAAVSGLVINFVSDPERMVREQARVVRPGGTVGWYVWDSTERMEFLQYFWDAAIDLDPTATDLYERIRFSEHQSEELRSVAETVGLGSVQVRSIDVQTRFDSFADYWKPFLGAQGPSPTYVAGLSDGQRRQLRDRLRSTLPIGATGSIDLSARAWAVKGTV